jgi:hypothetical protein
MAIIADTGPTGDEVFAALPAILQLAADWGEMECRSILARGKPLAFWQIAEAEQVGVREPTKVRILSVETMPASQNAPLQAALSAGLLRAETLALTLGYGVLILRHKIGQRQVLRHELRHVAQYEQAGSITAFLAEYLNQIARFGHSDAPLEIDARLCAQWKPPARQGASIGRNSAAQSVEVIIHANGATSNVAQDKLSRDLPAARRANKSATHSAVTKPCSSS